MRRHELLPVAVLALTAAGCGDGERVTHPARTEAPTATRTATPTTTALRSPRSVRDCAELWNADALEPSNFQVSANEFVAELAPVRVLVAFQRGDCFVVTPIGHRRIAISVAPQGRRPFTTPDRRDLEPGERVSYNARADRKGRVTLDL